MVPQSYIGQFCREKKAVKERWEKRQEGNLKKKTPKICEKRFEMKKGKKMQENVHMVPRVYF